MPRQLPTPSSQPPTIGASAGARPKIIAMWLITRCAWSSAYTSRTIARLMICPAPADSPCTARNTSRTARFGETAQPIEATM